VSLVWSAQAERAARFLADTGGATTDAADRLAGEVEALSHGELGSLRPFTRPAGFPLRSVHCRRVIAPSFVLIGDAAHAVHPMAGQGMNLGFGDVRGLMDALLADPARTGRPDWFMLRRYERSRREAVATMQLALSGLHQAFGDLPAPLVGLRDLGWEIAARSSRIRRRMIVHAVS
jgi:2-polyprenyl-6-methoxyphenol hydroxylase-like FAD-dependent oxidoreductase